MGSSLPTRLRQKPGDASPSCEGGVGVRRRRLEQRRASHERWLVSYADFITLLFAFFTTLYAISNVDLQKMHRLVSSLQVAFDTKGVPGAGRKAGLSAQPSLQVRTDAPRGTANEPTLAASVQ